jgi:hypothetical protein
MTFMNVILILRAILIFLALLCGGCWARLKPRFYPPILGHRVGFTA